VRDIKRERECARERERIYRHRVKVTESKRVTGREKERKSEKDGGRQGQSAREKARKRERAREKDPGVWGGK